ncbi:hypothetical protein [Methylophaga sp. OBS3]|uniref:hypothetical protein n=1 Tax=Methylophaga sp. OBS3 TaxID=2991934 RepID=UPI002256B098|nr:hypothetical protein [Methylophaga sp. OBS3]MCX4189675.1 hypothetical protein [Methylophaga sp. OBS3]
MIERDEDTYKVLMESAEDITLASRNYNDEIIGIDYYANLSVLTDEQLTTLIERWQDKRLTCIKERWASQWMVVQVCGLIMAAMFIAWLSGGYAGIFVSIAGVIAMIAMIEDKRVSIAKRNMNDAIKVCERLQSFRKT